MVNDDITGAVIKLDDKKGKMQEPTHQPQQFIINKYPWLSKLAGILIAVNCSNSVWGVNGYWVLPNAING